MNWLLKYKQEWAFMILIALMGMIGVFLEGKTLPIKLFVHDFSHPGKLEIFAYQLGKMFQGIVIVYWIYTRYNIKYLPIKVILLTAILVGIKTAIDCVINDNKGSVWYYDVSLWLLLVGFIIYRANDWYIVNGTTKAFKIASDGVYAIIKTNLFIGHLSIIVTHKGKSEQWTLKRLSNSKDSRMTPEALPSNPIVRRRIIEKLPINNLEDFIHDLEVISERKIRWRLTNNCLTILKPIYEKHGIKVGNYINPNSWIKNYQKNKNEISKRG